MGTALQHGKSFSEGFGMGPSEDLNTGTDEETLIPGREGLSVWAEGLVRTGCQGNVGKSEEVFS